MRVSILFPFLAACSSVVPPKYGDTEPGDIHVCDSDSFSITESETTRLGFSVAEAMAEIEGTTVVDALFEDGASSTLSLTLVQVDGPLTFTDRYDHETGGDSAACVDFVSVPVSMLLSTDDGSFDFDMRMELSITAVDAYALSGEFDLADNAGSYEVDLDGADMDESYFIFEYDVDGPEVLGSLDLLSHGSDGQIAWAYRDTVVEWGGLPE